MYGSICNALYDNSGKSQFIRIQGFYKLVFES